MSEAHITTNGKTSFWRRSYRNFDNKDFENQLQNHDWLDIMECDCPNIIWEKLHDILLYYVYLECPLKEFKIKQIKDPWVTPELYFGIYKR